jgi:hypothetical protein
MDIKLVSALIAAGASLAVSVLGQIFNPVAQHRLEKQKASLQRDIEEMKAALTDRTSAKSARRDYEYEARKRLYTEVEPLFFQLYECVEECRYRILSVARTSRQGRLGTGKINWLGDEGYYLLSTAYKFILPTVVFRLIQRRITFVDLKLDETLRLRYLLLKNFVHSFTDAFDFAALEPVLKYEPDWEDEKLQARSPAVHRPQGLVTGDLENVIDELIVNENSSLRACSFGEFEKHAQAKSKDYIANVLIELYHNFEPESHPILARMIVAQAGLCSLLMSTYGKPTGIQTLRQNIDEFVTSEEVRQQLSWKDGGESTDLRTVHPYLIECLDWMKSAP